MPDDLLRDFPFDRILPALLLSLAVVLGGCNKAGDPLRKVEGKRSLDSKSQWCEVHLSPLEERMVFMPMRSVSWVPQYVEAWGLFPHAGMSYEREYNEQVVGSMVEIDICPTCVLVHDAWMSGYRAHQQLIRSLEASK